ncbi:uncharacterized protein LOC130510112 [Raphanus sativus]|uniref:Uncharacterized protein LOC130510112 n=1 Tax=Raphanus sativus TaxID=3726 RepID=A0A9W3DFE3_RAPSA|nr:uncharacterized protein LOC130510112 [Raphanus sativus]
MPPRSNHHDNVRLICKTDTAWSKDRLISGSAWIFSGAQLLNPIEGSSIEEYVRSPLVAEAMAVRSALCMAQSMEITALRVFSDNRTLIRAISGNTQSKEIIGIVKDIRLISSEFACISFSHLPRSENAVSDLLAKRALQAHLHL